jgi:hypothetical protein
MPLGGSAHPVNILDLMGPLALSLPLSISFFVYNGIVKLRSFSLVLSKFWLTIRLTLKFGKGFPICFGTCLKSLCHRMYVPCAPT